MHISVWSRVTPFIEFFTILNMYVNVLVLDVQCPLDDILSLGRRHQPSANTFKRIVKSSYNKTQLRLRMHNKVCWNAVFQSPCVLWTYIVIGENILQWQKRIARRSQAYSCLNLPERVENLHHCFDSSRHCRFHNTFNFLTWNISLYAVPTFFNKYL